MFCYLILYRYKCCQFAPPALSLRMLGAVSPCENSQQVTAARYLYRPVRTLMLRKYKQDGTPLMPYYNSINYQTSSPAAMRLLQRVSIAKRCTYRKSARLSVCLSVTRWHCVKTTPATIMVSSLEDSPMTLVSSWLTLQRN